MSFHHDSGFFLKVRFIYLLRQLNVLNEGLLDFCHEAVKENFFDKVSNGFLKRLKSAVQTNNTSPC